jgi:hypothetical protein
MYQNGMIKFLNNTKFIFGFFAVVCLFFSCSSKSDERTKNGNSNGSFYNAEVDENYENYSGCKYDDGTYSATVDYNNPETGYNATYILDVDVQDCQVIQINFPNDGYLDEDHISYADIDEDGTATVYGEDNKTYEIQIDEL